MSETEDEMDSATLEKFLALVHRHTGITMTSNKQILLQRRLRPRLKTLGLKTYEEYVEYLAQNKDEIQDFVNSVTTHETSFFRTRRVWDFFIKDFLPPWSKERRPLRIWSAAA